MKRKKKRERDDLRTVWHGKGEEGNREREKRRGIDRVEVRNRKNREKRKGEVLYWREEEGRGEEMIRERREKR